jgi:hypothetical protein
MNLKNLVTNLSQKEELLITSTINPIVNNYINTDDFINSVNKDIEEAYFIKDSITNFMNIIKTNGVSKQLLDFGKSINLNLYFGENEYESLYSLEENNAEVINNNFFEKAFDSIKALFKWIIDKIKSIFTFVINIINKGFEKLSKMIGYNGLGLDIAFSKKYKELIPKNSITVEKWRKYKNSFPEEFHYISNLSKIFGSLSQDKFYNFMKHITFNESSFYDCVSKINEVLKEVFNKLKKKNEDILDYLVKTYNELHNDNDVMTFLDFVNDPNISILLGYDGIECQPKYIDGNIIQPLIKSLGSNKNAFDSQLNRRSATMPFDEFITEIGFLKNLDDKSLFKKLDEYIELNIEGKANKNIDGFAKQYIEYLSLNFGFPPKTSLVDIKNSKYYKKVSNEIEKLKINLEKLDTINFDISDDVRDIIFIYISFIHLLINLFSIFVRINNNFCNELFTTIIDSYNSIIKILLKIAIAE